MQRKKQRPARLDNVPPVWKEEAEKFSKGFGGKVLSYEDALKDLEGGEKKPAGS